MVLSFNSFALALVGLVIAWLVGRLLLFLQLWMLHFVFAMVDYSVCSWVSLVSVAIDIGISSKNLMQILDLWVTTTLHLKASSALFLVLVASSALFPVSAASSVLLPALFLVLLFSIDVLVFAGNTLSGLLFSSHCWCFCGHHSSFRHCPFSASFVCDQDASHHHLRVALDHGILELTLSFLLLLCRISSSSSRFICVYTPS
ncbi:hypothetical protein SO802_009577 [Lithocarpus litseifolius]|uniref:Uncharacterized protein n=1 Tax=Lithocarpus litseifolius TaxID=425828 RepID=A0AAW2DFM1_9ROSI